MKKQIIAVAVTVGLFVAAASSQAQTIVEQTAVTLKGKLTPANESIDETYLGGDLSVVTIADGSSTNTYIGSGIELLIDTNAVTTNLVGVVIFQEYNSVDLGKSDKAVSVFFPDLNVLSGSSNEVALAISLTNKLDGSVLLINESKGGGKVTGILGGNSVKASLKPAKAAKAPKAPKDK